MTETVSSLAGIISTTLVVQEFDRKGFSKFKRVLSQKYLLPQLGRLQQPQSIGKYLTSSFNQSRLSNSMICNIYRHACQISTKNHYGVIKSSKDNKFSLLSSDQINYICLMLSKKECSILGYTCRLLYIELQNKSYILNRRTIVNTKKENSLILGDDNLNLLSSYMNPSGFHNCFPLYLTIGTSSSISVDIKVSHILSKIFKQDIFQSYIRNFFYSLQTLKIHCFYFGMLRYIPFDLLFGSKHNDKQNLKKLQFEFDSYPTMSLKSLNGLRKFVSFIQEFGENYQIYFNKKCGKDLNRIRRLQVLEISLSYPCINKMMTTSISNLKYLVSLVCQQLNGNFKQLRIKADSKFICLPLSQLKNIFHKNIESVVVQGSDIDICIVNDLKSDDDEEDDDDSRRFGLLPIVSEDKLEDDKGSPLMKIKCKHFHHMELSTKCCMFWRGLSSLGLTNRIQELVLIDSFKNMQIEKWTDIENNKCEIGQSIFNSGISNLKSIKCKLTVSDDSFRNVYALRGDILTVDFFEWISPLLVSLTDVGRLFTFKKRKPSLKNIIFEWDLGQLEIDISGFNSSTLSTISVKEEDLPQFATKNTKVVVETDLSQQSIVNIYQNLLNWLVGLNETALNSAAGTLELVVKM